ncbi:peptidase M16 [[Phormidium ambiguum] IAM M-71]|uniref:Peptidase M16 n=1 Tax=[Phormidium ambiguum] IAM M-71 TaxID=454136 RepID=A0A1U7IK50_9CYAN|nr:pitrilysin family protein [Phormidium ambiguum]OKH37613.1 peptidase M16 [Phormidium ambiguum IAM M-71]
MSFSTLWRKYRRFGLIFSLCLGTTLLFASVATSTPFTISSDLPTPNFRPNTEIANNLPQAPNLTENVRQTVLENGLTVLTKEVHTAPVVTVQVWYKVGSRNEEPGVNGIAHQLEHLLFKGTQERPIQFGHLFSALGSDSNAFTGYDQTAYYGTVERDKLTALLTLEADRMQNSRLDAQDLEREKRVVISELQGYENSPEYRLYRTVAKAAFPNNMYGLPVGGAKADVEKFTLEQVRYYYETFYSPDNAILLIVGDIKTEPTLQTVKELFGNIPRRGEAERKKILEKQTTPLATSNKKTPIVLKEPGSAPLLQIMYPLPKAGNPDEAAVQVMDFVLTGGRSSRLYEALVESGIANSVEGEVSTLAGIGWYGLSATAAPNQRIQKVESVIRQVITSLQNQGVTAEELKRAKAQFKAGAILGNRDINSQATQLGEAITATGDYRYTDTLMAAISQVTAADVQRVAKKYLTPAKSTVGYFQPTQLREEQNPQSVNNRQTTGNYNSGGRVDPALVNKYLPPISSSLETPNQTVLPESFTLDNGMQVLLLPDKSTPAVTLSGYIRAGTEFDPKNKSGLAGLTAANLLNGTKTKNVLAIVKSLENIGASLGFEESPEGVSIDGSSLSNDLPIVIKTLADVLQNATFPADQLEITREIAISDAEQSTDDPEFLAYKTLQQKVYPPTHPFYAFPTANSLRSITRAEIVRFYKQHYRPDTMILTLMGDFDSASVRSLIQQQFGNWKATGVPPEVTFPDVPMPEKTVQLNPVIPGKSQAITFMGYRAISRKDPRFYAATVFNHILGGDAFASRLGEEIRDRLGLTYGIYSSFNAGKQPGLFLINMQTAPEDAKKAISSTLTLLQQVHTQGVTNAEVENAKNSIARSYPVQLADPDNLADAMLMHRVYDLEMSEIHKFPEKIRAVTTEEVNQIAKELLRPDNLIIVTAGPSLAAAK